MAPGFVPARVLGLEDVPKGKEIALGGVRAVLVVVVNFLTSGLIVGIKLGGQKILELSSATPSLSPPPPARRCLAKAIQAALRG